MCDKNIHNNYLTDMTSTNDTYTIVEKDDSYPGFNLSNPLYDPSYLSTISLVGLLNQEYQLIKDIIIYVDQQPDGYSFSNYELNIHSYAKFWVDALDEFEKVLISVYESYNSTPNSQLTKSAKLLKARLNNHIKS